MVRSRIGYIGQGDGAGHSFRVMDELVMQGRFYGMNCLRLAGSGPRADQEPRPHLAARSGRSARFPAASGEDSISRSGSMHSPGLLFLDEPSTGMDPHNRANLWEHINRLRDQQETTIVLTTHYLEEADAYAERVLVIDHGRDHRQRHCRQISRRHWPGTGSRSPSTAPMRAAASAVVAGRGRELTTSNGSREVTIAGQVSIRARVRLPWLLRELDHAGVDVRAADVRVPTLGRCLSESDRPKPARGEESEVASHERHVGCADTLELCFQREMSLVLRDPFSVIFSLVQPLVFLALFGPLLAGSVDPAAINGASPLQWFLPGVIVMICLFGTEHDRREPALRDHAWARTSGCWRRRCTAPRS